MLNLLVGTASIISIGASGFILWRAIVAQRATAQHLLDADRHSQAAERAALGSLAHSRASLAHSLSAKQAAKTQPLVIDGDTFGTEISPEPQKKSRRELIAEAAHAPEVQQRVDQINEHRARTSPLIPGNDPEAQGSNHAAWRARMSKR